MLLDDALRQTVREAVAAELRPVLERLERVQAELDRAHREPDAAAMLSTSDAAALMSVTPETIREWIKAGLLTAHGTDRALRVSRRELLALSPDAAGAEVIDLNDRARAILDRSARR